MQLLLAFDAQSPERLSQLYPTHLSNADELRQEQCFKHVLLPSLLTHWSVQQTGILFSANGEKKTRITLYRAEIQLFTTPAQELNEFMPQKTEVPASASWLTLKTTCCKHWLSGLCDFICALFSVHPPNTKTFCLFTQGWEVPAVSLSKLKRRKVTRKKYKIVLAF